MREQREDGEILVDYFEDLIDHLNATMQGEWHHVVAVSFFYNELDEDGKEIIKNSFQIFYQKIENGMYFDLLEDLSNHFLDEEQEIAIKKVGNDFESLHKYCIKCEDYWTIFRFDLYNEDKFEVNYNYQEISNIEEFIQTWKKQNNVV